MTQKLFTTKLAHFFASSSDLRPSHILIWIVGFIALSSLTLYDFLSLFDQYINHNVGTRVIVRKSAPSRPPHITVCLPYYSQSLYSIVDWLSRNGSIDGECTECDGLANRSWDVWNFENDSSVVNEFALTELLLKRLLDESRNEASDQSILFDLPTANRSVQAIDRSIQWNSTRSIADYVTLNRSNFNWNQPILDAITLALACRRFHDYIYLHGDRLPTGFHDKCPILTRFSDHQLDTLYDHSLLAIENYLKLNNALRFSEIDHVAFTDSSICLELNETYSLYKFEFRANNEESDTIRSPWMKARRRSPFTVWLDDKILYRGTRRTDALYSTREDILEETEYEFVTLTYSIDTRVIDERNNPGCDHGNVSRWKCFAEKQVLNAIEQCGCIPFTYKRLPGAATSPNYDDLPYCTMSIYESCHEDLLESVARSKSSCEEKCEYTFYDWKHFISLVPPADKSQPKNHWRFNLVLLPDVYPFVEFTTTHKNTPEQFLSQIGGVINLYLGVSGFSVCAFLIFCMEKARRWKNGEGATEDTRIRELELDFQRFRDETRSQLVEIRRLVMIRKL